MIKLFQKILSLILAVFMPTATVIPMTEPVKIEDTTVSASTDYILGETNYGQYVRYIITDLFQCLLYSNGEIVIRGMTFNGTKTTVDLIIPDEIEGYPVTAILECAFRYQGAEDEEFEGCFLKSVTIGNNVRYIGHCAFEEQYHLEYIKLGKNVEEIDGEPFPDSFKIKEFVWNDKIKILRSYCLAIVGYCNPKGFSEIPDSIERYENSCLSATIDTWVLRENVKYVGHAVLNCNNVVALNMDMEIEVESNYFPYYDDKDTIIYCLENSTMHQKLKSGEINNEYHLIENAYMTSETVDISEDYVISGLQGGLTEDALKSYLNVEGEAEIRVSDEVVKTGTKIELVNADPEFVYKTYTAVVDGDINGDGAAVSAEDFSAMRDIITGSDSEYSDINKQAADLNGDGIVNSTDLTIMKSLLN